MIKKYWYGLGIYQSLVSAAVGVHCTDVKGKRFSGWIRSERGRFCPKRHSRSTFSLSIESVLTSMDGRGNGRLSGIVLLLLSSFHQLVHVLGYFIIGYFGISLCRFNTRVSHHFTYTFYRDTCRKHQSTERMPAGVITQILLYTSHDTYLMYAVP